MSSVRRPFLILSLALAAVLGVFAAPAVAADGHVGGVVRDTTGAAVPGATVTVTSAAGTSQSAVTGADGAFRVTVPAGTYSVSVALRGFGRQTRREVVVADGATATADFALEPRGEEEVTVTAMLREQTVQDVPFSIVAPSEEQLRERGVENIEMVAANVAGFSVQNLGPGQSQVAMRGVSAGQVVRDQPGVKEQVGAYLDDSNISLSLFTPDLDLFDLNRVEVLRGPQGTLFGAGSLSGTVRYITNQPQPGEKKVFAELGLSSIQDGGVGGNAKLGFNAPLGEKAAVRVASWYTRTGGYIDAVQPDLSVNEDVNGGYRAGVRAAVRIAPSERFSVTPRLVYQKSEMDGWNRVDLFNILGNPYTTTRPAVTLGDRQQFTQIEEPFDDEFLLGDLNLTWQLGRATLTSVTSYTHRDVLVVRDATALTASITGGSIGLPPAAYTIDAPLDDATTSKVWTQELRLAGSRDRLNWVVGGFYSSNTRDYGQSLLVSGFETVSGIPTAGSRGAARDVLFFSDLHYELKQFAGFGELTYGLTDALSVTGGLRFYNFDEDRTQVFDGIFADPSAAPASTDASGVAPRLILSYEANDKVNLNAQVSRGFRLGGINDPLNVPLCTAADLATFSGRDAWEDETAWNYEIGAKSRVLNGRGALNVALFDIEIRDLQATVTAGSCSSRVIFNVPKARSRGVEAEFTATPDEHWDLSISGAYNNSELNSTLTSTSGSGAVSVVSGIEEGTRLPTVPKFQLAASATYQWQVRPGTLMFVNGSYQHIGSRFTQIGDQAEGFGTVNMLTFTGTIGGPLTQGTFTFDPELPAYDLLNVRVGLTRDTWQVAAYVNNLTDENARLALDQERGTRARVGYLTNPPRTFGITTRFDF